MWKTILRFLVLLVLLALLAAGGLLLRKHKQMKLAQAPQYGTQPLPVHVSTARKGDLVEKRSYLAVVEAFQIANISARLTSTVEQVLHDENETVPAQDLLLKLDGQQIRDGIAAIAAQIAQVQAEIAANEATVASLSKSRAYWGREAKRDTTLAAKGTIPKSQAEATVNKADEILGQLEAAQQKTLSLHHMIESLKQKQAELATTLDYCSIRSPFAGMIAQRLVDPGDLASPGKTLMVMEDRSRMKLCFDIPQQDIPQVREGLEVVFFVDGHERSVHLTHLFPSLDKARMLRAEVYLSGSDKDGLSPGVYVPLTLILKKYRSVVLVPAPSLVQSPQGEPYIFVVQDGQMQARAVQVLQGGGDEIAVKGIKPGEQVVMNTFLGWAALSSGMKVEVLQ